MGITFVSLSTNMYILLTLILVECIADPSSPNTSSAVVASTSQTSTNLAVTSGAAVLLTPTTMWTWTDDTAQPTCKDECKSHTEAADQMSSKDTKVTSEPSNTWEKCSQNRSRTTLPDRTSPNTPSAAVPSASQTPIPAVMSAAAVLLTPTTTLVKIGKTAQTKDECTDNPTGSDGNLFIWEIVVALTAFLYFMPQWLMYGILSLLLKLLWDIKNLIITNSD